MAYCILYLNIITYYEIISDCQLLKLMAIFNTSFSRWLQPISLILLLTSLQLITKIFVKGSPQSVFYNIRLGLAAVCIFVFIYFLRYSQQGLLIRPSRILYRLVQSGSFLYACIVIFMCFLTPEQVQLFLKTIFDNDLGQALPQKSYAQDCRIYTPQLQNKFANIYDKLDVFISAHFIGWLIKMLIVRDWKLTMFQSVFFQLLQVTFRHWLPNFYQCWWDHVFLDIIICNGLGILCGQIIMKKFNIVPYKWSMRWQVSRDSFIDGLVQFVLNRDLTALQWKIFSSLGNFLKVVYYCLFFQLCQLSFFFNKAILNIPSQHYLSGIRIWLIGFLSISATREYYQFIRDQNQQQFRANMYLVQIIIFGEVILFSKNYKSEMFELSMPGYVRGMWTIILSIFIIFVSKMIYSDIYGLFKKQQFEPEQQRLTK